MASFFELRCALVVLLFIPGTAFSGKFVAEQCACGMVSGYNAAGCQVASIGDQISPALQTYLKGPDGVKKCVSKYLVKSSRVKHILNKITQSNEDKQFLKQKVQEAKSHCGITDGGWGDFGLQVEADFRANLFCGYAARNAIVLMGEHGLTEATAKLAMAEGRSIAVQLGKNLVSEFVEGASRVAGEQLAKAGIRAGIKGIFGALDEELPQNASVQLKSLLADNDETIEQSTQNALSAQMMMGVAAVVTAIGGVWLYRRKQTESFQTFPATDPMQQGFEACPTTAAMQQTIPTMRGPMGLNHGARLDAMQQNGPRTGSWTGLIQETRGVN